jgi:hypothetical protein
MILHLRRLAAGSILGWLLLTFAMAANAADLPAPAGTVILRVTGNIGATNGDRSAQFDRALLERLGNSTIRTSTPWTEGVQVFEGVRIPDLLKTVQARGRTARFKALNDYEVEIPIDELQRYGVLLALKHNGEYMSIREKGPLWLIYPVDAYPELRVHTTANKMIWQIQSIEIR